MLAVTHEVQAALAAHHCESWSLQLDKFSFEREGDAEAKSRALRAVRETYVRQTQPVLAVTCNARQRWLAALEKQIGPSRFRRVTLVNDSRLLLHLSRASVLENVGLCTERTTGLPIIPGAALKGVLSTWACWEANESGLTQESPRIDPHRRDFAQLIFGDNSTDGAERAGDIVFLGGFPAQPPSLGLDIVNPHHEANGTPKRKLSPSHFLAVEPGTHWQFILHARAGVAEPKSLLDTAARWLTECLTQLGIGAKTAAGYGRFREPASAPTTRTAAVVVTLGDYPNDATFRNSVIAKLNPGQFAQLEAEVPKLKKPENVLRLEELKRLLATREMKEMRKRLRERPWFPAEWLPAP